MNQAIQQPTRPHGVTITDRTRVTITGIDDVDSFNEEMIVLNTVCGAMTIAGTSLNVTKLSLDDGSLIIDGRITAIEYDDRSRPAKGSGISRLFK
ncbi:MAG: sporulation protein YabP [Clostridia bacterium]|nr:sporulation protein YabP [Clostridia bacterium]